MLQNTVLALDTSALNRLAKEDDPNSLLAAITSVYEVRLPTMVYEEAVGTARPEVRSKLMDTCRQLVALGRCITAANWLLDRHVKRFHDDPKRSDWRNIQSRLFLVEDEVLNGVSACDEDLVREQATEMSRIQAEYEQCFPRSLRKTPFPSSFSEWLIECRVAGGSSWNTARGLYEAAFRYKDGLIIRRSFIHPPDEETLELFLMACPPINAIVHAFELTHYDRSLRQPMALSFKAGRNDQMMAVYLPYCDVFLTDDGSQHRCLTEIALAARIPVKIVLYRDFRTSLSV
jgi:hypothetical protein